MSDKNSSTEKPVYPDLSASLTAREVKVLARRFGIEPQDEGLDDDAEFAFFMPPSGGDSGQGGAPLNAVTDAPIPESETTDKNKPDPKMKRKH